MTPDEPTGKRGDGLWREQRDAVAKRNADAQKRAQAEREARDSEMAARRRAGAHREAEELQRLNAQIDKRNRRSSR